MEEVDQSVFVYGNNNGFVDVPDENDYQPSIAGGIVLGLGRSAGGTRDDQSWYDQVEGRFAGTNLKRCFKRHGVAPVDGSDCAETPKTCFFGTQDCDASVGGISSAPTTHCFCDGADGNQKWICSDQACPPSPDSLFT